MWLWMYLRTVLEIPRTPHSIVPNVYSDHCSALHVVLDYIENEFILNNFKQNYSLLELVRYSVSYGLWFVRQKHVDIMCKDKTLVLLEALLKIGSFDFLGSRTGY